MERFALALAAAASMTVFTACHSSPTPPPWNDQAVKENETWRATHERNYRREWATIEGLHFLHDGAQTAGSAAGNDIVLTPGAPSRLGRFTLKDDRVTFEPEHGVPLTVNGMPAPPSLVLRDDDAKDTDEIVSNGVSVVVHRSGNRVSLRVRDPNGPRAKGFLGFQWFPLERDYRVTARFVPDAAAHDVRVVNTFGDIDSYKTEGVLEFTLNGEKLRVRPFTTRPKRFYIVFKDASSGQETYDAARFLYADLRDDGTAILDFNQAYNPPCSFNPFTTCPIPLKENRLAVKVLAGEKKYPIHVALPNPGT
jgi:uncharacterized protein (DUF1684 family)